MRPQEYTTVPPPASQIRNRLPTCRSTCWYIVEQYSAAASGSVTNTRRSVGIPARNAASVVRFLALSDHIAGTVITYEIREFLKNTTPSFVGRNFSITYRRISVR